MVRQGWAFFQNDFAGRIANRVMQTGPALRESMVVGDHGGLVHPGLRHQRDAAAGSRRSLAGAADPGLVRCSTPRCCACFVPRLRDRSREVSEARSHR